MPDNKPMVDRGPIACHDRLPPLEERVMVVCRLFRCRGYIDADQVWRFASDDKPIEEAVLAWAEFV
jgi:hypothetical protein